MGSWRDGWSSEKKKLEKAKVDTGVFTLDFGSKIAAFEKAHAKVDDAHGELRRDDPAMVSLRRRLSAACDDVARVCVAYEKSMHHLSQHAVDAGQQKACASAASFLLRFANEIRISRGLT